MKIRNGFVSNSSSSSFICVYKNTDELTLRSIEDLEKWIDVQNNDVEAIRCTGGEGEEKEWFYNKKSMEFNSNFIFDYNIDRKNEWTLLKLGISSGTCGRKGFYDRLEELQKNHEFKVILAKEEGNLFHL